MLEYIIRRLIFLVPVLFIASIVIFLMIHLIPGDAAVALAGPDATPQVVEALREKMGLNKPLYVQYGLWIGQVLRGDLGISNVSHFKVTKLIGERLPATLELTIAALLISVLFAVPVGIFAALHQKEPPDLTVSVITSTGLAIPEYWSGLLAIILFAVILHWLPPGGRVSPSDNVIAWLKSLALPAITLAFPIGSMQARFVRSSMIDVMREQFILAAQSKGLKRRTVVFKHAFPNSIIPLMTVIGIQMGRLLGGAILVESIYNWPGIGRMMVVALTQRDYFVVQATVLMMVMIFTLINLATDVLYRFVDPRIQFG